ncbi:myrosinase 1-like [Periplaneta americana]|uniref:myrosinase 1-like n=1 Tax=Periplaneta americana TaxID=6978 RepID=UPI0037E90CD6
MQQMVRMTHKLNFTPSRPEVVTMAMCALIAVMVLSLNGRVSGDQSEENLNYTFPEGFMFGAATAAYQIEGAWNVDGKGPSVWDTLVHDFPGFIKDNSTGDDAAKSYYLYKEDAKVLKDMGMDYYRFSISWPRIMPTGFANNISQEGINYYNKVINNLIANNITPMVTIFHWDTPKDLQDLGGWANDIIVQAFVEYACVVFEKFGDRVKWWITVNEPQMQSMAYERYSSVSHNPNMMSRGIVGYTTARNYILAHALAYREYVKKFKKSQNGKISLSMEIPWFEPLDPNSAEDKDAAIRANDAALGWFGEPIFGSGDFPEIMKEKIEYLSKKQGFPWSRLPKFSPEEKKLIKGTYDFFALNYYSTSLVTPAENLSGPSLFADLGVKTTKAWWLPISNSSTWLTVSPQGCRRLLRFIKKTYGDLEIVITENGFSDEGEIDDEMRKTYIGTHLAEIWKAMYIDGVNVTGYTVWSSIDNMEWTNGYTAKFGLYYVNFTDPARPRIPKASSYMMKEITSTHKVPQKYVDLAADFSLDIRPETRQKPVLETLLN